MASTSTISAAGAHTSVGLTDRLPASKAGVKGYHTIETLRDKVSGDDGVPYSYYVTNRTVANQKYWTKKLNRQFRNLERPRINLYGDSTTLSSGASFQRLSVGELMAQDLTRRGIPAKANSFGLSFGTSAEYTTFDPRVTFTGTWGGWTAIQGGATFRATTASATMTWAFGYSCTTISLFWYRGISTGSMTVSLSGGATFSTPTSGGTVASEVVSMTGAEGVQELVITLTTPASVSLIVTNGGANNIEIIGAEAYDTTVGGVLIRCMGGSGLTSTDLVAASRLTHILGQPCEMSILSIGINDWVNSIVPATYAANLATLNSSFLANGISDIMYWTPVPTQAATMAQATQRTYVDLMRTAASTTIVVADLWQRWIDRGSQEALALNTSGYYNDTLHPSAFGNRDIAEFLVDTLMRKGQ